MAVTTGAAILLSYLLTEYGLLTLVALLVRDGLLLAILPPALFGTGTLEAKEETFSSPSGLSS